MKINIYLLVLYLILVFTLNTFAQDYTKWHLPNGAIARLGKGTITDLAYSPDGRHLVVLSSIGIWIYDPQTGSELDLIREPYAVRRLSLSPDGKLLACVGANTIRIWDVGTGKVIRTLIEDERFEIGSSSAVEDVSFSPDSKLLVTSGWENKKSIKKVSFVYGM